jgi:hypothetical protein
MTPHIVRSETDMKRIVAEEARKMSWSFNDVQNVHGHGLDVLKQPVAPAGQTVWGQVPQYQSPLNNLHQYLPGAQPPLQATVPGQPAAVPSQYLPPSAPTAPTIGAAQPAAPGVAMPAPGQVSIPTPPVPGMGQPGGQSLPPIPNVPGTPTVGQPAAVNPAAYNPSRPAVSMPTPPAQQQQTGAMALPPANPYSAAIFQPPGTKEGDKWSAFGR